MTGASGAATGERRRRRAAGLDAGQSTVELALVLPFVVLILLAVVQLGVIVQDQLLVTHAAREAARAAAVSADAGAASRAAAAAGPLDPTRLEVAVTGRAGAGSYVHATVRYRADTAVPLIGPLVGDVDLHAEAAMRVES
jgi:Flp pilus assembly protein TadG